MSESSWQLEIDGCARCGFPARDALAIAKESPEKLESMMRTFARELAADPMQAAFPHRLTLDMDKRDDLCGFCITTSELAAGLLGSYAPPTDHRMFSVTLAHDPSELAASCSWCGSAPLRGGGVSYRSFGPSTRGWPAMVRWMQLHYLHAWMPGSSRRRGRRLLSWLTKYQAEFEAREVLGEDAEGFGSSGREARC